jgi:hypothetical protein
MLRRHGIPGLYLNIWSTRLAGFYVWNTLTPLALAFVPAVGDPLLLVPLGTSRSPVRSAAVRWSRATPAGFRTTPDLCRRALERADVAGGVFGVEFGSVALDRARILEETLPEYRFSDIAGALTDLPLVARQRQVDKLRDGLRGALIAASHSGSPTTAGPF